MDTELVVFLVAEDDLLGYSLLVSLSTRDTS